MNWKNLFVSLLFIVGMEGVVLAAVQPQKTGVQVAKCECSSKDGCISCPP